VAGIPFFAITGQYLIKISNTKSLKKRAERGKRANLVQL
jgi:hypothetical protein